MINVDRKLEVNPADAEIQLSRQMVWDGLVRKAENAVPFVDAITTCDVLERDAEGFTREIVLNGETMREHITFVPQERVIFDRLPGASAMGRIVNQIEEGAEGLVLRFIFDLDLVGAGPKEEAVFARSMEQSYLAAVSTTLERIRSEQSERA